MADAAFLFSVQGDFTPFDRGAQSAWDKAQGYINKKPIRLKIDDQASLPLGRIAAGVGNFDRALDAATKRVITFGIAAKSFAKVAEGVDAFVASTIKVQDAFVKINVSMNLSQRGLENFKSSVFNIARDTGQTFDNTAKAAERLSKQNLGVAETAKRLRDAMTLVRLTGLDSVQAINDLTATLNTFNKESLTSTDIIDKLAVANNKFGVSGDVFAEAIERSGLVAKQAGVNFNQLLGLITAVQKITGRDGAAIGTSLTKVFAGLEKPETREKLQSYGINVKDSGGNQLNGLQVLQNTAVRFGQRGFSQNDKANVLEAISGQRQEENTLALLGELAKQYNLVTKSVDAYKNATGAAKDVNDKQNQSLLSLINSAKVSFTQLSSTIGGQTINPALKGTIGVGNQLKQYLSGETGSETGKKIGEGIIQGIVNFISGPGLAIAAKVITTALGKTLIFAKDDLKGLLGLNEATEKRAQVQARINDLLKFATQEELQEIKNASTLLAKREAILDVAYRYNKIMSVESAGGAALAEDIVKSGANRKVLFGKNMAEGHIPAIMNEMNDISHGVGGASSSAKPVVIPRFNFGNGTVGMAVANSDEYIVPNFAGGGDAVFNKNMVSKYGVPNGARHLSKGHVPNFADFNPSSGRPLRVSSSSSFGGLPDDALSALDQAAKQIAQTTAAVSQKTKENAELYRKQIEAESESRKKNFEQAKKELSSIEGKADSIDDIYKKRNQTLEEEKKLSTSEAYRQYHQLNSVNRPNKKQTENEIRSYLQERSQNTGGISDIQRRTFSTEPQPSKDFNYVDPALTDQQKRNIEANEYVVNQAVGRSVNDKALERALRNKKRQEEDRIKTIAARQKREAKLQQAGFGLALAAPFVAGMIPEGESGTAGGEVSGALRGGLNYGSTAAAAGAGPWGAAIAAIGGALIGALEKSSESVDELAQKQEKSNDLGSKIASGETRQDALRLNQGILNAIIRGDKSSANIGYLQATLGTNRNKEVSDIKVTEQNAEAIAHSLIKSVNIIASAATASRQVTQNQLNTSQEGRAFLGPKDFLNYSEKSATGFGAAGAASRLSGLFSAGDTSRNGYLTETQRAKGTLGFYEELAQQLPEVKDLDTLGNYKDIRQKVQRANVLNASAQFLQHRNPAGRYFDFRGEPIAGAVSQGLDYVKTSTDKSAVAIANDLANRIKSSEPFGGLVGASFAGKSLTGTGKGITYNGIRDNVNHHYQTIDHNKYPNASTDYILSKNPSTPELDEFFGFKPITNGTLENSQLSKYQTALVNQKKAELGATKEIEQVHFILSQLKKLNRIKSFLGK